MIDNKFITALIETKFSLTPTNITKLNTSGTMNIVYLIEFNSRKLIIRLRENDPYAENEFLKEQWFSKKCEEIEIPVPRIMYTGKYNKVDYLIEEYIEGISRNKYENKAFVFEKLGLYAKKIKEIPISGYGVELLDFTNNVFTDSLYNYPEEQITQNIEALTATDKLIDLGIYDIKYINHIKNSFSQLMNQDLTCVLNHGDISLNNTIVSPEGIVYLIDFGSVNANSIYSEFASLKTENEDDLISFAKGFGISAIKIKEHLSTYQLLSSFDKLRWSLTTENAGYINWYSNNAKNTFHSFINNINVPER